MDEWMDGWMDEVWEMSRGEIDYQLSRPIQLWRSRTDFLLGWRGQSRPIKLSRPRTDWCTYFLAKACASFQHSFRLHPVKGKRRSNAWASCCSRTMACMHVCVVHRNEWLDRNVWMRLVVSNHLAPSNQSISLLLPYLNPCSSSINRLYTWQLFTHPFFYLSQLQPFLLKDS